MRLRLLIIFLLLALFGILQISFLAHFNVKGSAPSLIFILYFLVVFFEEPKKYIQSIFSAVVAGFFLDAIFLSYFGETIAFLLIMVFVLKYIIFSLKKIKDKYPVAYFAPLFILFFVLYRLFLTITLNKLFWVEVIYNLAFALFGFYIYKRIKLYELSK